MCVREFVYLHLCICSHEWKPLNRPLHFTFALKYCRTRQTLSLYHVCFVCVSILASYRLPVLTCQCVWYPWQSVWKHNVGTRQNWLAEDHFGWGHMRRLAHSGYHNPWLNHVLKSCKSPECFIMASVLLFPRCISSTYIIMHKSRHLNASIHRRQWI